MPSKQPAALARRRPQAIAHNKANVIVWRWGREMLGTQRASPDSEEMHADAALQPRAKGHAAAIFFTKQRFYNKRRSEEAHWEWDGVQRFRQRGV
jgi:hypothetical protein